MTKKPLDVLVCGGRDYSDFAHLSYVLDLFLETVGPINYLINGFGGTPGNPDLGIPSLGADILAYEWATARGIKTATYKANWTDISQPDAVIRRRRDGTKYDAKAGPRRNEFMLEDSDPDIVIAFPGGDGTAHMCKIAELAGKKVIKVSK